MLRIMLQMISAVIKSSDWTSVMGIGFHFPMSFLPGMDANKIELNSRFEAKPRVGSRRRNAGDIIMFLPNDSFIFLWLSFADAVIWQRVSRKRLNFKCSLYGEQV